MCLVFFLLHLYDPSPCFLFLCSSHALPRADPRHAVPFWVFSFCPSGHGVGCDFVFLHRITMTPLDSSQAWDAMSDQQRVEWFGEFAWHECACICHDFQNGRDCGCCSVEDFDPLHDWNHWRQVEEKVMEDERLGDAFMRKIENDAFNKKPQTMKPYKAAFFADLPTRCEALFTAYQSLYGQR